MIIEHENNQKMKTGVNESILLLVLNSSPKLLTDVHQVFLLIENNN